MFGLGQTRPLHMLKHVAAIRRIFAGHFLKDSVAALRLRRLTVQDQVRGADQVVA